MQQTPNASTPAPSPMLFWDAVTAFQRSAAIKAAIELDVFTKIAQGNKTSAAIGEACSAKERGIRILCDALTIMGFLSKQNNEYTLTESSAVFLNRNSPAFIGGAVDFILSPMQKRGFEDLTEAVRQGGSTVTGEGSLDANSPMWVKFARGMMGLVMPSAQAIVDNLNFPIDRPIKVLDIAAGHGVFGITIAQKFPNAEIYAADWANVLQVAEENAQKFGVAERYHTIPGSAFDVEFGEDFDVILLTNFLHHFDGKTNENLLRKIHQSLKDDGRVMTLEMIPNDDRISPPGEAMFSLVMLAGTPAGDAYTFAELREMFENANFSRNQHIPLPPLPQHLVISMK